MEWLTRAVARSDVSNIAGRRKPLVRILPTVSVTGSGVLPPRVAAFSSRGPSATFPGIIKFGASYPSFSLSIFEVSKHQIF
uniref:Uncharacterized protein n=1 Tax=Setaria italica TaxID=4555 RepID=K3YXA6_SETIT